MNTAFHMRYKSIVNAVVDHGSIKILEYLMQYNKFPNIDLSCVENDGQVTALISASFWEKSTAVRLLLNHAS